MVWSETLAAYYEMISEEGWATKNTVEVPVVQKLTFKVHMLRVKRHPTSDIPFSSWLF
jgi:hypothetical protein